MKILIVHPEDSPRSGPWIAEKWDGLVDLGKSSALAKASWQELLRCPFMQLDELHRGREDFATIRQLLDAGCNQLLDEWGIDWWDLVSIFLVSALEEAVLLRRLRDQLPEGAEFCATRPAWPATGLALLTQRPLRSFGSVPPTTNGRHYVKALRKFSAGQLAEIWLDKYDSRYRWRRRVGKRPGGAKQRFVLLPSAYTNVSRVASAYARLLPEQQFLMVATRRSGTLFDPTPNITRADLGAYVDAVEPVGECRARFSEWEILRQKLQALPEFSLLSQAGLLEQLPELLRTGLVVRNAWRNVLATEQVVSVMCGDDSNPYTRLPVLLARELGIPTLNFHHGALDGRFLTKRLVSDLYLAKNEMERDYLVRVCNLPNDRVVVGAPSAFTSIREGEKPARQASQITFFSEPYENSGRRTEEIYRELLPVLCRIATEHGKHVVLKLHPFESPTDRSRLLDLVLCSRDRSHIRVEAGGLTETLLQETWFGLTVESTTVMDCTQRGVPCFLCEWLSASHFGYVAQYARFGVGQIVRSAREVGEIPNMLARSGGLQAWNDVAARPMSIGEFRRFLGSPSLSTSSLPR